MTFTEFWPIYLREHASAPNRHLHYIGTALTLPFWALFAVSLDPLWLLGAAVAGYGFAWTGHFFIEKNRPATFAHPIYSLICDYRMFFLWAGGRLAPHLRQAGVET